MRLLPLAGVAENVASHGGKADDLQGMVSDIDKLSNSIILYANAQTTIATAMLVLQLQPTRDQQRMTSHCDG